LLTYQEGDVRLKSLKGILVVGEKNIFAELAEIATIAAQANTIMKSMFKMGYDNDHALVESMHAVRDLEKKSDVVAFKLSEDITSGAVSPNILDNLIECAHVADNIVDTYYYLSREIARMGKSKLADSSVHQEADWIALFEKMLNLADQSLSKLKQALTSSSVPEILQLRKEIETLEEDGDDIKDAGFDKLYGYAANMHFLQFYHYSELLHKCDDVLDGCEDLSDLIVSIVTSILK
jgi:uncharacterized protein Yka (UPF0111/DUF47 family)